MKWFAYVSDTIDQIYPGDGPTGDLPRNIEGFEHCQNIEIPETLDRLYITWDGSKIVEDSAKKQKYIDDAWMYFRIERNSRLQACDWTHCTDSRLSPEKQQAWSEYRQALRDLPANTPDPTNPTWPTPPS
jgi:hypothetical protein